MKNVDLVAHWQIGKDRNRCLSLLVSSLYRLLQISQGDCQEKLTGHCQMGSIIYHSIKLG